MADRCINLRRQVDRGAQAQRSRDTREGHRRVAQPSGSQHVAGQRGDWSDGEGGGALVVRVPGDGVGRLVQEGGRQRKAGAQVGARVRGRGGDDKGQVPGQALFPSGNLH